MKRLKTSLLLLALFWSGMTTVQAQDFMTLNPDVRTAGMANASVAASGGSQAIFTNVAAALFTDRTFEFGASYSPWMRSQIKGYDLIAAGGYLNLLPGQTLAIGTRIYCEPKIGPDVDFPFLPKDEFNNPLDGYTSFRPVNFSLEAAYGIRLTRKLGLSLTARYLQSKYGEWMTSNALDFDLALYTRLPLDAMLDGAWVSLAAKASDMGFSFGDGDYTLPTRLHVGGALHAPFNEAHALQASLDLGYRFLPERRSSFGASIGAEYTLKEIFSLRAGYHVADKKGYNYGTVGVGLRIVHLSIDFSYLFAAKECPWRNSCQVGLGVYF